MADLTLGLVGVFKFEFGTVSSFSLPSFSRFFEVKDDNPGEESGRVGSARVDFSLFGLVAFFRVDILGFPELPCFGDNVPNGLFGLEAACFGLVYTGECFGLGLVPGNPKQGLWVCGEYFLEFRSEAGEF